MLPVIVTAIEAGALEHQTCLLAESIRRWGGRLSNARIIAVKPRPGPAISIATTRTLDRLGVEYWQIARDDRFQWFPYVNKTAAVRQVAERHAGTVIWLDADTIILNEPTQLILDSTNPQCPQFAACAIDKNIGTSTDDDEFAPYFKAACRTLGINFATLPYVVTEHEQIPIRAYWNSGVYAFFSNSGFADLHHRFTLALLAEGVASRTSQLFFTDQIALGLAAHALSLPRRDLPATHNYSVQPHDVELRLRAGDTNICILHYHGCLWPPHFDHFCESLSHRFPESSEWIRSRGPLVNTMPAFTRLSRKLLQFYRSQQYKSALRRATYY
jgi:hypothetical protein